MIVRQGRQVEQQDTGVMRGEQPSGIKVKWLIHRELGDESYGHRFAVREFVIESGKAIKPHNHKYVEAFYVVSGRALVEGEGEKVEVGPGDLVYTYSDEVHAITPIGNEEFKIVCSIDCIDGGDNCSPAGWVASIKRS